MAESREHLAAEFSLTSVELTQLLPSGRQSVIRNRVDWAKTYLVKAGLLSPTRHGYFRISDRGQQLLREKPDRIDIRLLERFPEFVEFRGGQARSPAEPMQRPSSPEPVDPQTPEEAMENAYERARTALGSDLLTRVKSATPEFFESLVVELLVKMGYGGSRQDAGAAIGRSGDEGIDGTIREDRLGLDVVYLQAKKWEATIGRPEIQRFVGALHGKRAHKGVFITTSSFSSDARSYVEHIDPKVVLIDGTRLTDLMIEFGVGVNTVDSYAFKRIDSDYFIEE